jgi:hypothetical protein
MILKEDNNSLERYTCGMQKTRKNGEREPYQLITACSDSGIVFNLAEYVTRLSIRI